MKNNDLIQLLVNTALQNASNATDGVTPSEGIEVLTPLNEWAVLVEFDVETGNVIVADEDGGDHQFTIDEIEVLDIRLLK
jgi:hypothetical protein